MKPTLRCTIVLTAMAAVAAAQAVSPRTFRYPGQHHSGGQSEHRNTRLLTYVITGASQFGAVDLKSGTFIEIGPALPPDVGGGLVAGPGSSLLSLAFSGNLVAIHPAKGTASVVGATGLADCMTPIYLTNCPNGLGNLDDALFATDLANNLYSVNPKTGKLKLIGPTGIPAVPFVPLSSNSDGSVNVYDESLFSSHGKLYANFATAELTDIGPSVKIAPGLYEINPRTGRARLITSLTTADGGPAIGLTSIVEVEGTVYGFRAATNEVVTLDLRTGEISAVSDLSLPEGTPVVGATPIHPSEGHR
jgi:outer membrane protein assembly factor BamB